MMYDSVALLRRRVVDVLLGEAELSTALDEPTNGQYCAAQMISSIGNVMKKKWCVQIHKYFKCQSNYFFNFPYLRGFHRYRAVVLEVVPEKTNSVNIELIDHGIRTWVPFDDLRPLPERLHRFARCCGPVTVMQVDDDKMSPERWCNLRNFVREKMNDVMVVEIQYVVSIFDFAIFNYYYSNFFVIGPSIKVFPRVPNPTFHH